MPMENSFTFTPSALAAVKCPSSWMPMRMPKMRMAKIIYIKKNAP